MTNDEKISLDILETPAGLYWVPLSGWKVAVRPYYIETKAKWQAISYTFCLMTINVPWIKFHCNLFPNLQPTICQLLLPYCYARREHFAILAQ